MTFLLFGCIDEFPLDADNPPAEPVIEGLVTDLKGTSLVRISTSLNIQGIRNGDSPTAGSDASVEVVDSHGELTTFCEKSPGLYRPEDESFAGTIGYSYQLTVTTTDGRTYQSNWELMHPGVLVDSVFLFFEQTLIPGTQQLTGNHDFFATVSNKLEQNVNFRIESNGIAQVAAYLDPPPPGCGAPRCAEVCYSFRSPINRQIVLGSTKATLENKLTLQVAEEPYDFHSRYFIKVTAFSLSPEGVKFWNSILTQQQIEGSIFDPQLNEIEGTNIINTASNQSIIGYFGASAASADSLIFNRSETAGFPTPIPTATNSCTEVWEGATLQVPVQFR
ncbi:MAG: hypothetical protein DHS20C17_12130 [Cyclobacteriaceae bacterium]|nr:MAG: hypothetical protein DHS20C17_12130 [Cyclobacteriaceae bacterium]